MKRSQTNRRIDRNHNASIHNNENPHEGRYTTSPEYNQPKFSYMDVDDDVEIISLEDTSSEEGQALNQLLDHVNKLENLAIISEIDRDLRSFVQNNIARHNAYFSFDNDEEYGSNNENRNLPVKQRNYTIINRNTEGINDNIDFADIEIIQFEENMAEPREDEQRTFDSNLEAIWMYSLMNRDNYLPKSNLKIFELPKSEPDSLNDSKDRSDADDEERVPTPMAQDFVPPLQLFKATNLPTVTEITESKSSYYTDKESLNSGQTSTISPKQLNNWIQKDHLRTFITADEIAITEDVKHRIEDLPNANENDFELKHNPVENYSKKTVSSQTKRVDSIEVKDESSDGSGNSVASYDSHPNQHRSNDATADRTSIISQEDVGDFDSESDVTKKQFHKLNLTFTPAKVPPLQIPSSEVEFCEICEQNSTSVCTWLINCVLCR